MKSEKQNEVYNGKGIFLEELSEDQKLNLRSKKRGVHIGPPMKLISLCLPPKMIESINLMVAEGVVANVSAFIRNCLWKELTSLGFFKHAGENI